PAANSNMRVAERGPVSPNAGAWSRSVPHPPSASGFGRGANNGGVASGIQNNPRSNVSRPTTGMSGRGGSASVPRPSGANVPSGYSSANNRNFPSAGNSRPEVPRPSPSYQANNRGSYGRSEPNYNSNGSYNRPAPSYSRPAPSYSRPTPSYGGGAYSRPAPSYERGSVGRSMPSYGGGSPGRSMPSYGGGGHSMPSYGGGGRAPSYGGGGGGRSGGF